MKNKWIEQTIKYDGTQLHSLFAYLDHGLLGDSIVAWQGPCDVPFKYMVDGEDLLEGAKICGDLMLHFIIEKFDSQLITAVTMQRLFSSIALDALNEMISKNSEFKNNFRREGDDIYIEDKKLSISIATQSPVSSLIHFAVNITNKNTPVKTVSLNDFEISSVDFAKKLMDNFCGEVEAIVEATQKVKWVR